MTTNNQKKLEIKELETLVGGAVPVVPLVSLGVAAVGLTYNMSYAMGKSYYHLTHR